MTGWHEGTVYAFDTETTGVSVFDDRIVSACVVKLVDGQPVDQRDWLINPGIEIPDGAAEVHGITTEHARQHGVTAGPAVVEIGKTVTQILKSQHRLFVFNAPFDLSLLESELRRHRVPTLTERVATEEWHRVIDPLVLARGIDKNLTRSFKDPATGKGWVYKLPALCDRYKVTFAESHEANADAVGAARLGIAIAKKYPQVGDYPPQRVHDLQRTWHRSNMDSLRAYFDRQGTKHDGCDGGFPLHTDLMTVSAVA